MLLTWRKVQCELFGWRYDLEGLPTGCSASARRTANGKYLAHAYIGGRYLSHSAKSLTRAIHKMENEIDKRSIGLLNTDTVQFTIEDT